MFSRRNAFCNTFRITDFFFCNLFLPELMGCMYFFFCSFRPRESVHNPWVSASGTASPDSQMAFSTLPAPLPPHKGIPNLGLKDPGPFSILSPISSTRNVCPIFFALENFHLLFEALAEFGSTSTLQALAGGGECDGRNNRHGHNDLIKQV